jgi:protein TonB
VAAAPASQDEAPGRTIVEPRLLIAPSDAEFAEVYPETAFIHGRGGRSSMICRVRRNRTLADCRLTAEAPAGQGFGAAILDTSREWRLSPRRVDGREMHDGLVELTVDWALP